VASLSFLGSFLLGQALEERMVEMTVCHHALQQDHAACVTELEVVMEMYDAAEVKTEALEELIDELQVRVSPHCSTLSTPTPSASCCHRWRRERACPAGV
jgi:ferritin